MDGQLEEVIPIEITINDVRDAVIVAIKKAYPVAKVYGEQLPQGFKEPCFFVLMLESSQDKELDRRYKRFHPFDIHYFASSNSERYEVAEKLTDILGLIEMQGKPIRGTKMRHTIVDDVLHFFVDYNFYVVRPKPVVPTMQKLKIEGGLKDG
ncbi:phage tail terminator family protein [Brevibacillus laterosporus]|uniref:phage tail terminator family protein n=1 Tax=Brevibacillus laterosporus TaxID=1465 RepID=UPI003D1F1104